MGNSEVQKNFHCFSEISSTVLRVQYAVLLLLITWKKKWEIPRYSFSWGLKPNTMDPKVKPTHAARWQQMPRSFVIYLQANVLVRRLDGWMDHMSWVQERWWQCSKLCRRDWIHTGSFLLLFLYMGKQLKYLTVLY